MRVKEVKVDGIVEIKSPYSRRTKIVTRKMLRSSIHPP